MGQYLGSNIDIVNINLKFPSFLRWCHKEIIVNK